MEVTGTTQIGVVDDSAGAGGRSGRLVVGDERGDALASQAANLDGASRYSLGTLTMEISIKAQDARHVRKPCSGCGRLARMATINPSVCGPIEAAHRRKRAGVHSA